MERSDLEPVAQILVPAYLETASYSRQFRDDYGEPPTSAAKVHHMRSITQVMINRSDRYLLAEPYVEFGRVEFKDMKTGDRYLLRSESAVKIERNKRQREALFDSAKYLTSSVMLVIHSFHIGGLELYVAGTQRPQGRFRLEASGPPTWVGSWSFSVTEPPPFDQGVSDPFEDLGGLEDFGEDSG